MSNEKREIHFIIKDPAFERKLDAFKEKHGLKTDYDVAVKALSFMVNADCAGMAHFKFLDNGTTDFAVTSRSNNG